jgi:hypothetical protein
MLDSLSKARLLWMFDNQPEYTKEFLDQGRIPDLHQELLKVTKPAWELKEKLEKAGKSYAEALDLALESVILSDGPEFSDNPPTPLPDKIQEQILRRLEIHDERQEREFEAEQKRRNPRT